MLGDRVLPRWIPCYLGLAVLPQETSPTGSCTDCSKTTGLETLPYFSDAERVRSQHEAHIFPSAFKQPPWPTSTEVFSHLQTLWCLCSYEKKKNDPIFHETKQPLGHQIRKVFIPFFFFLNKSRNCYKCR